MQDKKHGTASTRVTFGTSIELRVRRVCATGDAWPDFPVRPIGSFVGLDVALGTDGTVAALALSFERDPLRVFVFERPSAVVRARLQQSLDGLLVVAARVRTQMDSLGWPVVQGRTCDLGDMDRATLVSEAGTGTGTGTGAESVDDDSKRMLRLDQLQKRWLPRLLIETGEVATDAWVALLVALSMVRPHALPAKLRDAEEEWICPAFTHLAPPPPASLLPTMAGFPVGETHFPPDARRFEPAPLLSARAPDTKENPGHFVKCFLEKQRAKEKPAPAPAPTSTATAPAPAPTSTATAPAPAPAPTSTATAPASTASTNVKVNADPDPYADVDVDVGALLADARMQIGFPRLREIARRASRILSNSVRGADVYSEHEWFDILIRDARWIQ